MRIAFFHHSLILGSGIDTDVYEIARRVGRDHESVVLTFFSDYEEIRPATLQILPTSIVPREKAALYGAFDPRAWASVRRVLPYFDIVNVHTYPANLLARGAPRVRHVATEWGAVNPDLFPSLRERAYVRLATIAEKYYARSADLVIAPCPYVAGWIRERFGVNSVVLYLDGVNFSVFDRERVDPTPLRDRFPNLRPGPVILTVGRITPSKNLETLISALAIVREQFPNAVLVAVGRTSSPDYEAYLRAHVLRLGLQACVIFTGTASWADLARLYKACDVYATASLWEGFLRAEASAMGKPMVAFDVAANPDTITDGITGILVRELTARGLAQGILRILHDPETGGRMGEAGYQWTRSTLDYDAIAKRFVSLLEERVLRE